MEIISKFNQEILSLNFLKEGFNIAVATSGGSDSLALCFLMHDLIGEIGGKMVAITIDHKLRNESFEEALKVKATLNQYNIEHVIISWDGDKPSSNIQEEARLARYRLLAEYCLNNDISYLMTGHQQNDQAENFIIRVDHGSGVYGLSGIPAISKINGIKVVRPLLNFTKQELQGFLKEKKIKWIEDPSNQNDLFTRVRVRKILEKHPEWIVKLANVSKNLSKTKDAIEYMLNKSIAEIVENSEQGVFIDLQDFNELPQEIRFRMLSKLLQKVSEEYKPARAERIENLMNKIEKGLLFKASTLSKCIIRRKKNKLLITKEYS